MGLPVQIKIKWFLKKANFERIVPIFIFPFFRSGWSSCLSILSSIPIGWIVRRKIRRILGV
jgi:hypothetical protein